MLFEQALSYPLVKRWAASASLDRETLRIMWGADEAGDGLKVSKVPEGMNVKQADVNGFKVRDGRNRGDTR